MDKVIHKTLDKRDELLGKVKADIEKFNGSLDLDLILEDPESALIGFGETLAAEMIAKHAFGFIQEGRRFAQDVVAKRVEVQKSKDPNANKDEVEG